MGEIIKIDFKQRPDPEKMDLNDFLKQAHENKIDERLKEDIILIGEKDISEIIKKQSFRLAAQQKLFNTEIFISLTYAAKMLEDFLTKTNTSMVISDYLLENDKNPSPQKLKEAANVCFLICTIFTGRLRWRLMNENFYTSFGPMLYKIYYSQTNKAFAYCMQAHFKTTSEITSQAINSIKKTPVN